jgi:sugar O-acyltransferase (sialic acid O-acetyltransferase NeuD family)
MYTPHEHAAQHAAAHGGLDRHEAIAAGSGRRPPCSEVIALRDLIIFGSVAGSGGHAAEMVEIVERINDRQPTYNLLGYILPEVEAGPPPEQEPNGYPVLGTSTDLPKYPRAVFCSVNGRPPADEVPTERLVSLIDPTSWVSRTAHIGAGVVIYPHCFVGLRARLHDHVFCLSGCIINHDCVLETGVALASGVTLAGTVHVGTGGSLGQSCTVREGLTIGAGSLVGMGAVVTKSVPDRQVVVGNPARKLRDREDASNVAAFRRRYLDGESADGTAPGEPDG